MPLPRHLLHFGLAMLAYIVVLVISLRLLARGLDPAWLRVVVSLAPMLPVGFGCWSILRTIRALDEFQRKVQLEAFALAFAGTAMLTFGYGFLENVGAPKLTMFWVWPVMAMMWMVGVALGSWRYR